MNTTFLTPNKTAGIIFNKVTHHSLVTLRQESDNAAGLPPSGLCLYYMTRWHRQKNENEVTQ